MDHFFAFKLFTGLGPGIGFGAGASVVEGNGTFNFNRLWSARKVGFAASSGLTRRPTSLKRGDRARVAIISCSSFEIFTGRQSDGRNNNPLTQW